MNFRYELKIGRGVLGVVLFFILHFLGGSCRGQSTNGAWVGAGGAGNLTRPAAGQVAVSVDMSANHAGGMISTNFMGLSFEVNLLLTNEDGQHYFRPDNAALVNLFETLGVKSLR